MTNHEMCLAAAKAAGYTIESGHAGFIKRTNSLGLTEYWNPLEVDADAFRLMVDCGIELEFEKRTVAAVTYSKEAIASWLTENIGTDKHAATKRAVVRAAAAMRVGE